MINLMLITMSDSNVNRIYITGISWVPLSFQLKVIANYFRLSQSMEFLLCVWTIIERVHFFSFSQSEIKSQGRVQILWFKFALMINTYINFKVSFNPGCDLISPAALTVYWGFAEAFILFSFLQCLIWSSYHVL